MKHYNLQLEQKQLDFLKEIAKEKEETVSKLIRDAIDAYTKRHIEETLNMEIDFNKITIRH